MDPNDLKSNALGTTVPWISSLENKISMKKNVHKRYFSTSGDESPLKSRINEIEISPSKNSPIHSFNSRSALWADHFKMFTDPCPDLSPISEEKKNKSLISKLNEEILILSEQLKQSNEIINFLNDTVYECQAENQSNLLALQQEFDIRTSKTLKDTEDQRENINQMIEIMSREHKNQLNELNDRFLKELNIKEQEHEQHIEKLSYNHKKQLISTESHFIEIIMNLNHKFVEEIEYLNKRYRNIPHHRSQAHEKASENYSDKDSEEASTLFSHRENLFSPQMNSLIKRDNVVISPLPFSQIKLRKLEESDYDFDLAHYFNKSHDGDNVQGPEIDIKIRSALRSVISITRKTLLITLKFFFSKWTLNNYNRKSQKFHERCQMFVESMEKCMHRTLKSTLNYSVDVDLRKVTRIFERNLIKHRLYYWRYHRPNSIIILKEMLNITSLIEFMKKKSFSLIWSSWKCLKNHNKENKIRNRKLIKKYIELWEKHIYSTEDKYFETFYHWRGLSKREKIYKLKEYKQLFC